MLKLRAAGVEVDETGGPVQPRVRAVEPAFGPLLAAVQAGQVVTFPHRRGGPTGEVARRTVEPWGVVSARGRWYLVGHDRDRADVALVPALPDRRAGDDARAAGAVQVPPEVDLLAVVDRGVGAAAGDRDGPAVGRGGPGARPAPAGPGAGRCGPARRPTATSWRSTCAAWTPSPAGSPATGRTWWCCTRRSSRPRCGGRGRRPPRRTPDALAADPRTDGVGAGWRDAVR